MVAAPKTLCKCQKNDSTSFCHQMSCVQTPIYESITSNSVLNVRFFFIYRFIARPCAMGLKIQANGPQKAQSNAILEKVFTAITKVA